MKLIKLEIEPCQEGEVPLSDGQLSKLHTHVSKWEIVEREGIRHLERAFEFPDFARALAFTDQVGELAEAAGHHPTMLTEWGKVTVTWWTHETQGLHRIDFVMAAKLDGESEWRIIARYMLPGFMSYIIVSLTLSIPQMILWETALSFLGVGLKSPTISWGVMLHEAQDIMVVAQLPWVLVPVVFVVTSVLMFNFLGDGLRDAADPYVT